MHRTGSNDMDAQVQALQDDLAQQQAETQAQQLMQAQQQAQAPVIPPQAPAVPFALTPAQAITDVIKPLGLFLKMSSSM